MDSIEDIGNWSDQEMMAEELLIVDELETDSNANALISLAYSVRDRLHDAGVVVASGPASIPIKQVQQYLRNGIKTEIAKVGKFWMAVNDYFSGNAWTIRTPVAVFWMEADEQRAKTEGIMCLRFYGLDRACITSVMQCTTKLLSIDGITVSKVKRKHALEFFNSKYTQTKPSTDIFKIEEVLDAAAVLEKLGWNKTKIKTVFNRIVTPDTSVNAGELVASAMREVF